MNEILLNYIVQAILGGASGYITNDYAINMLFKEYTPLKLGGVIKKTRIEFIENLSSMVENDIINKEKLHDILSSDEFKVKFEKLTDDFYDTCLYETVGVDKFSNIAGFDSTLNEADKYVEKILNEHMESMLNLIADNFDASYFLTQHQSEKAADSIYSSAKDVIENTNIIENTLVCLYENNRQIKLTDILGADTNTEINKSVNKFAGIFADNITASKVIQLSGLNEAFSQALNILSGKQIKDIIKIDGEKINSLILSEVGKDNNAVYKICQSLFSYLKSLDKSIYSILDPDLENSLKSYIEQNLPYVTDSIVSYVEKNSMIIDRIIIESADEVIKESDGLRAKLLATVKNTYFQNLGKKYNIVDKIISFIRTASKSEKLSVNISNAIIERLDSITFADIIKEAESNNFNADKAYSMVIAFISKNSKPIIGSLEQYVSKLHIGDVLPLVNLNAERLLSSPLAENLLKNKSAAYIESMLSKELSSLISEEDFVSNTGKYLKMKFNENEESIKCLIMKIIQKIHIDKSKLTNPSIVDFTKKEAYDKYKGESSKLKFLDLTAAIEKLNSIENISQNSSETLRKFMINNTDTILKGSIKGLVSNNLNKLSDEELITFANDFIGRELKPIMFFGGILGIMAGLILAAFQNSPLNPGEVNAANMATYAFVGFITNVVAINMIFKPYKEIKFLSKIPFLRNFSLGYIIKNQKGFAESTAHYIDNSLLNKKSINELFDKHKTGIKTSFAKNIAENNYQTLSNLLIKNMENTISGTYGFLKNKILKNINQFNNYLYGIISKTKISSLITDKSIDYLSNSTLKNIKNISDLSNKIYRFVKSEKKLKTEISGEFFIKTFHNKSLGLYDKGFELTEPDNFKKQILKYNLKYLDCTNKGLNLNDEKLLAISNKISEIILSQNFKQNVSSAAIILFNQWFDRNKNFEDLFDGKVKTYIDKNLPGILANLSRKIKKSLAESKSAISLSLQAELKNHLGFIERGMFSFMGGDEIIDELLNKILTQKLPKFMDAREDEINNIIIDIINEKFYKAQVEVLYSKLNNMQINEMVENYFSINSEKIKNKTNKIIIELYNKSKNNTNNILKMLNLEDLKSFYSSYEAELNAFAETMHGNLISNKNELIKEASSLINTVTDEFMNLRFSNLFNDVQKDDIDRIIYNIIHILDKENNLEKIIKSSLEAYKEYNKNLCLDQFIDKNGCFASTEKFVNKLLMNQETEEAVKTILRSVLSDAANSNFNFIDSRSKEYIVNIFVDSSIESLRINLDEILKSVEFDKIAAEEIEKMEPEKIHHMFNSFGEKYFRRLMIYGFGGFVFGINMYVGFALTGLKIISEIFKKD